METARSLYEEDFARWSAEQAGAIRAAASVGANLPLDWENIAEEIESLGKSLKAELRSRISNVIEHLLKLRYSPADDPRRGWGDTIKRERNEIEVLLEDSPSLRSKVVELISKTHGKAAEFALDSLDRYGEFTPVRRRAPSGGALHGRAGARRLAAGAGCRRCGLTLAEPSPRLRERSSGAERAVRVRAYPDCSTSTPRHRSADADSTSPRERGEEAGREAVPLLLSRL